MMNRSAITFVSVLTAALALGGTTRAIASVAGDGAADGTTPFDLSEVTGSGAQIAFLVVLGRAARADVRRTSSVAVRP